MNKKTYFKIEMAICIFVGVIGLPFTSFAGWSGFAYTYDTGKLNGVKKSDGSYAYTLNISNPQNWYFASAKGTDNGTTATCTDTSATGTRINTAQNVPTNIYAIRMGGKLKKLGSGAGAGAGTSPDWSALAYCETFYYIQSNKENNSKQVVIPAGGSSVTFSAYSGNSSVSSYWTAAGTQSTNTPSSITISSLWSYNDNDFSNGAKLKPGEYAIVGKDKDKASNTDAGTLQIVQGDFIENTSKAFDDYTCFTDKTVYYTDKTKGRAPTVYAVKKSSESCNIGLDLTPSAILKDVSVATTTTRGDIGILYPGSSSTTVNATLDGTTLCSAVIYSYPLLPQEIQLVIVNGDSKQVSASVMSEINSLYEQAVISWSLKSNTISHTATPSGANGEWTYSDIQSLVALYPSATNKKIAFLMPGYYTDHGIGGLGRSSGHVFLFRTEVRALLFAHELGHGLGLDDEYTYIPPASGSDTGTFIPGPDKDNLMNTSSTGRIKLRKHQWTKIR